MSTYTFTTIATGRISIDAGMFNAAPDSSQVVLTWDKANRVSLGFLGITINIDATKDPVVIDGTSHAPNFYTGATLYSALVALFPKANTGSGGSGGVDLSNYYTKAQVDSHNGDITITDATKGFVLATPTGEHIRITAYKDSNGQPQLNITLF